MMMILEQIADISGSVLGEENSRQLLLTLSNGKKLGYEFQDEHDAHLFRQVFITLQAFELKIAEALNAFGSRRRSCSRTGHPRSMMSWTTVMQGLGEHPPRGFWVTTAADAGMYWRRSAQAPTHPFRELLPQLSKFDHLDH